MQVSDNTDTLKGDTVTERRKLNVIDALVESHGIVTPALKATNTPRSTFYDWKAADPVFKQLVDDTHEIAIDTVESAFFDNIKSGNVAAQIFYLKTRAKNRGYVERFELVSQDKIDALSDAQLDEFLSGVPYSQLVSSAPN